MGADLLTAHLWSPSDAEIDWEAGLRAARELSEDSCDQLAEMACREDESDEEMRALAVRYVETLRAHLTGWSRELSSFTTPDHRWACWLTGGMSWGDSPGDLYDAINDLYAVPEVLTALGFWDGVAL